MTACAGSRPPPERTSSSRALSRLAESLPASQMTGVSSFGKVALAGPHGVAVAPERVDLAVVRQHLERLGEGPARQRVVE